MKAIKSNTIIRNLAVAALVAAFATGCAWSIGGTKEPDTNVHQASKGQELLDLKRAKDAGAITDAEYEVQKERILNK
jgi:hypothetical protein